MKLGGCETVIRLTTSYYCHGPENRWRRRKIKQLKGGLVLRMMGQLTKEADRYTCTSVQFRVAIHLLCDSASFTDLDVHLHNSTVDPIISEAGQEIPRRKLIIVFRRVRHWPLS
jgi:hypothetical protein